MSLNDQPTPVLVKLVPNRSIKLASMCKARDVTCCKFRVESSEIAKLASDGRRSATDLIGKFLDEWVSGCDSPEWNPAVQLKREY